MVSPSPKILFLYAHIQPFLLSGISSLIAHYNAEVLVVSWPKSGLIPLELPKNDRLSFIVKNNNIDEVENVILKFDPDIVYGVGWMDKDYMKWTAALKTKGKKTVMSIDNQWKGSFRQWINSQLFSYRVHRSYTHIWVPGYAQYEYARRLGFKQDRILLRLLTPDTELFERAYIQYRPEKMKAYPHTFLYAGRLVENKFGKLLRAFAGLSEQERNGWKLLVAGDGPLKDGPSFSSAGIDYRGFLQPGELADLVKEAGVFCLLSDEEPWGTVIEEFARAGMPLLLSANCGAAYSFLIDKYNGLLVRNNTEDSIRERIRYITALPDEVLMTMGDRSNKLACASSSEAWAATLMSVL